ncbi:MAG: hypothetical protein QHH24_02850 [Candidatus Bathyarchaeota archaeon]|nr:hypothetical protein [Candidatus Bathyarchaeota archaeon]
MDEERLPCAKEWRRINRFRLPPIFLITEEKAGVVTLRKSYFKQRPTTLNHEFWGYDEDIPPAVEYLWKLDIIDTAIKARFRIDCIEEFCYERKTKGAPLLPTDFLLVATKC